MRLSKLQNHQGDDRSPDTHFYRAFGESETGEICAAGKCQRCQTKAQKHIPVQNEQDADTLIGFLNSFGHGRLIFSGHFLRLKCGINAARLRRLRHNQQNRSLLTEKTMRLRTTAIPRVIKIRRALSLGGLPETAS